MSISRTNINGRWVQTASSVQSLSELLNSSAALMDYKNLPRSTVDRVERIYDPDLRRDDAKGLLRLSRCAKIYEAIAKEYPEYCPVLLLWAVRHKIRARALARNIVRRWATPDGRAVGDAIDAYPWQGPPRFGGVAHRAMAAWFYSYRRNERTTRSLRGEVLLKDWASRGRKRGANVPEAGDRS